MMADVFSQAMPFVAAAVTGSPYSLNMVNVLGEDEELIEAKVTATTTNVTCTRNDEKAESSQTWESFLMFILIFNITAIIGNFIILSTILVSRAFRRLVDNRIQTSIKF